MKDSNIINKYRLNFVANWLNRIGYSPSIDLCEARSVTLDAVSNVGISICPAS